MQKTIFYYNEKGMKEEKNDSGGGLRENHNLWIDISDPTNEDITNLEKQFSLNKKALDRIKQKSKKPVVKETDGDSKLLFCLS